MWPHGTVRAWQLAETRCAARSLRKLRIEKCSLTTGTGTLPHDARDVNNGELSRAGRVRVDGEALRSRQTKECGLSTQQTRGQSQRSTDAVRFVCSHGAVYDACTPTRVRQ